MSGRYELTRSALADLDELWTYIAEDNVEAADRVSAAILDACSLLAHQPLIGHLVERSVLDRVPARVRAREDYRHLPRLARRGLAAHGP